MNGVSKQECCQKDLGHLEGKWLIGFKAATTIAAILLPALVGLMTWQVSQIHALSRSNAVMDERLQLVISRGPAYSPFDAQKDNAIMKAEILSEVASSFPPLWLREELSEIKTQLSKMQTELNRDFVRREDYRASGG